MASSANLVQFPTERAGQNTRMKILHGAAKAFGDTGLAMTTVEEIIAAAGVSRPSFYKFFRNKEEVFDLLHEMFLLNMSQAITSAVERVDDPIEKLEAAVEAFLRLLVASGPMARAIHAEGVRPGSPIAERERGTVASLTEFFRAEATKAERSDIDPLLFRGLVAGLRDIGYVLLQETAMTESDIQRGKHVAMRMLVGSLAEDDEVPPLPRV